LQEVQFLMIGPGALDRNLNGITYHLNAQKTFSLNKVEVLCGYQYNFEELDFVDERQNFVEAPIGLESAEFQRQLHGLVSIAKLHGETNSNFFQAIDVDLSFRYDQLANKQKNPIIRDKSSNPEEKNIVGIFNDNCWQETALKFALNLPGYHQNLIFNGNINFGINKKFPTLLQQISSPARLYSADAEFNLQPEKNVSTEVNLNLGRDIRGTKNIYGWKISGNFFQNLFENKFRASTTPGMPVQFYDNVPNASLSGFESASSVFLFKKKMTMELGISRYFISEKSAFPFKSDFKRTMTVTFDHAGFSFQLHWFKEGEQVGWIRQQDGSFAEIVLAEYSNLDLHLSSTFRLWKLTFFANLS